MAFRLMDFGIPNYDTNVNVLYKQAVEQGESVICGAEEYVWYRMGETPLVVVLRFAFAEDGETPEAVTAHTFLESDVRWQEGVQQTAAGRALVMRGGAWLQAEVINETAAGSRYLPMLFADSIRFGATRQAVAADLVAAEGTLVPVGNGVQLLARVAAVTPVVMSKLWLFSIVTLTLADGTSIVVPVSRDEMERQLSACSVGALCALSGQLSLMKEWA